MSKYGNVLTKAGIMEKHMYMYVRIFIWVKHTACNTRKHAHKDTRQ